MTDMPSFDKKVWAWIETQFTNGQGYIRVSQIASHFKISRGIVVTRMNRFKNMDLVIKTFGGCYMPGPKFSV